MTYANPDALVDTAWLADHFEDGALRIIEVDEDVELYDQNHIPGAIAWSWTDDLHHPVRRDYLDQEALSTLLAAAGVGADTTVALYGGMDNWFAAYAYWLLKYRGFDNVKLVDGGRKKWELDGLPLTSDVPKYQATDYRIAGAERPEFRKFRDDVLAPAGETTFLDVRSPEEFSGEKLAPDHLPQEQPYVGGHIPGAHNIPWSKATNDDGSFKSAAELEELYRRDRRRRRDHRLLPNRRAFLPYLVRVDRAARSRQRQQLRRFLDRVRLACQRASRARFLTQTVYHTTHIGGFR